MELPFVHGVVGVSMAAFLELVAREHLLPLPEAEADVGEAVGVIEVFA